jgi:tetratricopeptide (TPR) repeat protein
VALGLVLALSPAAFSAPPVEDKVAAKQHFEAGTRHYDLAEWDHALVEFKEAYRLKPDATFLYNIAQCHRKLGHIEDALTFYRTYLRRAPDAPNHDEVERRIAELEVERKAKQTKQAEEERVALAEREAKAAETKAAAAAKAVPAPEPAPAPTVTPSPASLPTGAPHSEESSARRADLAQAPPAPSAQTESSIFSRWWFWTAVGAVVAGGVTAGLLLSRKSSSKTFCPDCVNTVDVNLP